MVLIQNIVGLLQHDIVILHSLLILTVDEQVPTEVSRGQLIMIIMVFRFKVAHGIRHKYNLTVYGL